MDSSGGGERESWNEDFRWTEELEDLLDGGDIDGAISLLQSIISRLETLKQSSPSSQLRLASAVDDLAKLYYSQGLSTKADDLRSRSLLIRTRVDHLPVEFDTNEKEKDTQEENVSIRVSSKLDEGECGRGFVTDQAEPTPQVGNSRTVEKEYQEEKDIDVLFSEKNEQEDGWEAIADRPELLDVIGISRMGKQEEAEGVGKSKDFETPKRRGRGSFFYNTNELYSDNIDSGKSIDYYNSDDGDLDLRDCTREDDDESMNMCFGTRHILVIYDFPPSTRTVDLEGLLERYKETGIAIRWVNDTCALAVFRTPTLADEAKNCIAFPFKVRQLDVDDSLLDNFSPNDLQPPHPRPKTSARTAKRLITQIMGLKLSSDFGSNELRKQEEARKNRIHTRQSMRDDAWGPDDQ